MKRYFVTGSRYYGTPRKESDIDILADGTQVSPESLTKRGYIEVSSQDEKHYPISSRLRRFVKGRRDVLLCMNKTTLAARKRAKQICGNIAPVSRDLAICIHKHVELNATPAFEDLVAQHRFNKGVWQ